MVSGTSHEDDTVVEVTPPAEQIGERASAEAMGLLSEHVPLTLLADLAHPEGPRSPEILRAEGLPKVAWWE
jgi:hypothetical protein